MLKNKKAGFFGFLFFIVLIGLAFIFGFITGETSDGSLISEFASVGSDDLFSGVGAEMQEEFLYTCRGSIGLYSYCVQKFGGDLSAVQSCRAKFDTLVVDNCQSENSFCSESNFNICLEEVS